MLEDARINLMRGHQAISNRNQPTELPNPSAVSHNAEISLGSEFFFFFFLQSITIGLLSIERRQLCPTDCTSVNSAQSRVYTCPIHRNQITSNILKETPVPCSKAGGL